MNEIEKILDDIEENYKMHGSKEIVYKCKMGNPICNIISYNNSYILNAYLRLDNIESALITSPDLIHLNNFKNIYEIYENENYKNEKYNIIVKNLYLKQPYEIGLIFFRDHEIVKRMCIKTRYINCRFERQSHNPLLNCDFINCAEV